MLKSFKIHVSKIFLTDQDEKEDMKLLAENAPKVVEKMQEIEKKELQQQTNPVQKTDDDKYTLDHTIVVYLMGP